MANAVQITPLLWQLKLGLVNSYLLHTEDGLLLIDSGCSDNTDKMFAAVREAGHDPANIRHLLLTHIDHAGNAAEIRRRTRACTYAHPADAPLIETGVGMRPNTTRSPGLVETLVYFFYIKGHDTSYEPLPVDQLLTDGQVLPLAGDIEVIHVPGHCAGQVVLLLWEDQLLIAADICSHTMGLGESVVNKNHALACETILRVAEYPFERAVFGHGDELKERANQQKKFSKSH